jgi:streptogramin lyase
MAFRNRFAAISMILVAIIETGGCDKTPEWEDPYREAVWKYFDTDSGLSSNRIISLKADSRGRLWAGTWMDGLMQYDGLKWTHYGTGEGLPDPSVYDIEDAGNGKIWIATWSGLSLFDGKNFIEVPLENEEIPAYSLHLQGNGHLWVGTFGSGVFELSGNTVVNHYWSPSNPLYNEVEDITEDTDQVIWAGTRAGILQISRDRVEFLDETDGLYPGEVRAVKGDRWGDVWIGIWAAENVLRYERQTYAFHRISLYNVYPDTDVKDIAEDDKGNIWFGLSRGGVVCYNGSVMRTYRMQDGLPSDNINCIEMDPQGNIWFGSDDRGLARYSEGGLIQNPRLLLP